MPFRDQIAWITGASSGIGEALAVELARQGAILVLSARREEELKRVADRTGLSPDRYLILPLDMTRPDDFPGAVAAVLNRFQRIDYLFQNAGITQRGLTAETELSVYRRLMELNFFGVVGLTKAVLPAMLATRKGHFIVTSSVAGKVGIRLRSGYCASKHALHGFFDALRAETHAQGLRVTLICPGYIKTPISLHALDAQGNRHDRMDENQARGMAPEACARAILRAVAANKEEAYIGGKEIAGIYLKRFFPGLLSRVVRSMRGA